MEKKKKRMPRFNYGVNRWKSLQDKITEMKMEVSGRISEESKKLNPSIEIMEVWKADEGCLDDCICLIREKITSMENKDKNPVDNFINCLKRVARCEMAERLRNFDILNRGFKNSESGEDIGLEINLEINDINSNYLSLVKENLTVKDRNEEMVRKILRFELDIASDELSDWEAFHKILPNAIDTSFELMRKDSEPSDEE